MEQNPDILCFSGCMENQREAAERNIGKIPYLTFLKGGKHNKYEKIQNIVEQNPDISYFSGCMEKSKGSRGEEYWQNTLLDVFKGGETQKM